MNTSNDPLAVLERMRVRAGSYDQDACNNGIISYELVEKLQHEYADTSDAITALVAAAREHYDAFVWNDSTPERIARKNAADTALGAALANFPESKA